MEAVRIIEGIAAPLPEENVDTDAIIPAQCLRSPSFNLADGLFLHRRFDEKHRERPDFVLNKPTFRRASILIAGDNFGCGSSREHAVWALKGSGIRCVMSTSFGEIFFHNCFKNGLLPIILPQAELRVMMDHANAAHGPVRVDLEAQTISMEGARIKFDVNQHRRELLLLGLDEIGITMKRIEEIRAFRNRDLQTRPWAYAVGSNKKL